MEITVLWLTNPNVNLKRMQQLYIERSTTVNTWHFAYILTLCMLDNFLQQGISEPIFYGNLVYKFKQIVRKPNFSDQFKKIVKPYIRVGYNSDIMRQSACLDLNPIMVYSYDFLLNCMWWVRPADSMTALT